LYRSWGSSQKTASNYSYGRIKGRATKRDRPSTTIVLSPVHFWTKIYRPSWKITKIVNIFLKKVTPSLKYLIEPNLFRQYVVVVLSQDLAYYPARAIVVLARDKLGVRILTILFVIDRSVFEEVEFLQLLGGEPPTLTFSYLFRLNKVIIFYRAGILKIIRRLEFEDENYLWYIFIPEKIACGFLPKFDPINWLKFFLCGKFRSLFATKHRPKKWWPFEQNYLKITTGY